MLGPSLLCAPVMAPGGAVSYYLPAGRWTDLLTGAVVQGGAWRQETRPYREMPVMVRPCSLIPLGASETEVDYDYTDAVAWHAFQVPEGARLRGVVFGRGGEEACSMEVRRAGRSLTANAAGSSGAWSLVLRGVTGVGDVEGGAARQTPLGTEIQAADGSAAIRVTLPG